MADGDACYISKLKSRSIHDLEDYSYTSLPRIVATMDCFTLGELILLANYPWLSTLWTMDVASYG